mgnify:CR=1 FL=1
MTRHYIGLDAHCQFTEFAVVSSSGHVTKRLKCATTIPALVEVIESVKRPRQAVFEEGPMAEWLYRSLLPYADGVTVCEPRRNRWIAQEGRRTIGWMPPSWPNCLGVGIFFDLRER